MLQSPVIISSEIVLNAVFMDGAKDPGDPASWRRMVVLWSVLILIVSAGCLTARGNSLPLYQMQTQDLPVLLVLAATVCFTAFKAPALRLPARLPRRRALLLGGLALASLVVWGAYAVFENYPLSRDEHMVVFDMAIYNSGRLAQPLPPFWRPYAGALVPDFLVNEKMPIGIVSGYLPINALLRLGFSKLANPVWFNPLLALAGGWALLDIARREFGPNDRVCWVVLLIYGLSAQMLVSAMTPYSVTAHMALNLMWLAAFLRGGKAGHALAIFIGFLAVGLHQLVFHPVFVAPFLLWRLKQGQWRIVLLYAAAYVVIVAWWAAYPLLLAVQSAPGTTSTMGETHRNFLTERVLALLTHRTPGTTGLMVLNMLRFFAWQNFALLPLLVAAVPVARRQGGLAGSLLLGVLVWVAIVTLLMPYQGLGWGFRYLSPYLGSFALIAGFGYRDLARRNGDRADGMILSLSAVTAIVALPFLLVTTRSFAQPYLALEGLIARQKTPVVVIDTAVSNPADESWALHPLDQVRNLPDLSERPIRLSGNRVNAAMIEQLCAKGPVTMLSRHDMHGVGFALNVPVESPRFESLAKTVNEQKAGCLHKANASFTKTS